MSQPAAYRDYFGNWVHRFNVLAPHRQLRIEAESVVMVHEGPPAGVPGASLAELDAELAALADEHHDFVAVGAERPGEHSADLARTAGQDDSH